jgi:monoamine oxidase
MSEKPTIIIIGSGVSGLGAARRLFESGYVPLILEARDRFGGRVCSHSFSPNLQCLKSDINLPEVTIQLGANWIHGLNENVNPFYRIAKKLGLELQQTSSDDEPGDDVLLFDTPPASVTLTDATAAEAAADPKGPVSPMNPLEFKAALEKYQWIKDNFDRFLSQLPLVL